MVGGFGVIAGGGDVGVGGLQQRGEISQGRQPGLDDLGAELGQLLVPDRQGGFGLGAARTASGQGLQQGRALLEHPLVVSADAGHPRPARGEEFVQEAPAGGRVALHHAQILRREDHHPQRAEQIPRPLERRPIEAGPIRLAGDQLHLEQQLAGVVQPRLDPRPHPRTLGAVPHQRQLGRHPVRTQRGKVLHRLDQVRLPLPVGPGEDRDAGLQRNVDDGVRAEVDQVEVGYEQLRRRPRGRPAGASA